MTIDPRSVGRRMREARVEAGLTQEDFAHIARVTLRTVQHWEAGDNVPYRKMDKLAQLLDREVRWFLHGDGPDPGSVFAALADIRQRLDRIEAQLASREDAAE
jgi:transcriptional regulator with XRE-family HTH domain